MYIVQLIINCNLIYLSFVTDFEDAIENYRVRLKKWYNSKYVSETLFTPKKFINLSYIIHKPRRSAQETEMSAKLARLGNFPSKESMHSCGTFDLSISNGNKFDKTITIKEEISDILLPINSTERPQLILIEGAPGIGKTMLMREIGRLWANEKILNNQKIVLLLNLCDCEINKISTNEDMFFYSCKDKENAKIYANYFESNDGQGLLILLDGLDENQQIMQAGKYFYDLIINRRTFMEACIIITSRPHATAELQKFVSYRVEIIGLTNKKRCEFVQENVGANLEKYIQIIGTLCCIPSNMTNVFSLFKRKHQLPETKTKLTEQAVTKTVHHNLQKLEKTTNEYDLLNLPKPYDEIFHYVTALAYNAMAENKLTFTSDEIRKAFPVPTNSNENIKRAIINGLGLIHTARYYNDDSKIESLSNFAHYSIQELLAAWYIAFSHRSYFRQMPLSCNIQKCMQWCFQFLLQLKELKANLWKIDYINVLSFYVGLTGGNDLAFRYYLFGGLPQCKSFHRLRQLFNIKWLLQEQRSNEIPEHLDGSQCMISKEILKNKLKTLLLYFWLQEVPDHEMIKNLDVVVTKNKLDLSGHILYLKHDVYLLGYVLSKSYLIKQWESVDLSYCEVDDEMFEVLHEILTINDGRPKPEIKALSLSGNKLKSCSIAIANLICCQNILHLNLSNNVLDELASLKTCGNFLEFLDISNNKLNNEKALELFSAMKFLKKLKVLKLNHNNISNEKCVIDAIGLALCYCNLLKQLELDGNSKEFENKAMLYFQVVNEVRSSKSNVHYYRLSDKAFAFLKILGYCDQIDDQPDSCILKNKIMLSQIVNISYSGLRTDAGCSLGQHLHLLVDLKKLNITKNNVSDEATKSLTMGLLLTPHLEEFKYDENLFSEDATKIFNTVHQLRAIRNVIVFKCAPSEIKALVFILKCLGELNEEELLLSDIASTISDIEELILSHDGVTQDYKINSKDIIELCAVLPWLFKQLKVLDLSNVINITDEARDSLALVMLQICTLQNVKL